MFRTNFSVCLTSYQHLTSPVSRLLHCNLVIHNSLPFSVNLVHLVFLGVVGKRTLFKAAIKLILKNAQRFEGVNYCHPQESKSLDEAQIFSIF